MTVKTEYSSPCFNAGLP